MDTTSHFGLSLITIQYNRIHQKIYFLSTHLSSNYLVTLRRKICAHFILQFAYLATISSIFYNHAVRRKIRKKSINNVQMRHKQARAQKSTGNNAFSFFISSRKRESKREAVYHYLNHSGVDVTSIVDRVKKPQMRRSRFKEGWGGGEEKKVFPFAEASFFTRGGWRVSKSRFRVNEARSRV